MKFTITVFSLIAMLMSAVPAGADRRSKIEIKDVTDAWTYRYEVMSAFPGLYKGIWAEENADITHVFHFLMPKSDPDPKWDLRRIEVYYTGGDWMSYGFVYFITDAELEFPPDENGRRKWANEQRVHFIPELSTSAREDGDVPPKFRWHGAKDLMRFIRTRFLDRDGTVNARYVPQCQNDRERARAAAMPCEKRALPVD